MGMGFSSLSAPSLRSASLAHTTRGSRAKARESAYVARVTTFVQCWRARAPLAQHAAAIAGIGDEVLGNLPAGSFEHALDDRKNPLDLSEATSGV
jgi:hypothetical protein